MFSKALVLLFLSQALLLANSRLEQLKTEAMAGSKNAVVKLADAYFHGNVKGIPQDYRQAYIWGTVYMKLDPSFGRGIERVTIFAEQELFAQQQLTTAQLNALNTEADQLVKQIRSGDTRPSSTSNKNAQTKLGSIPSAFIGTWTQRPNGVHPSDGELPLVIRAKQVEGHEWGGEAVSIIQNAPGDITVLIEGESEAMPYKSQERWVIGSGNNILKITNLGQSSYSRTVYRVRR